MRVLFLTLALAACTSPVSSSIDDMQTKYEAEQKSRDERVARALKTGSLVLTRQYYSPDLTNERWFKVEDQFGCKWWISNGHKFDHNQIDVRKDGEANCPDAKNAPEKEYIYRDRAGSIVDITNY